jgi:hypothetical protein
MSSLTDILTATKNIVTAINSAAQTYANVNGIQTRLDLTSATLVKSGEGRVSYISVTVAGTTVGKAYDATSTSGTSNAICAIPNTIGVYQVNIPFTTGLVVTPGTGQTVTVSYS